MCARGDGSRSKEKGMLKEMDEFEVHICTPAFSAVVMGKWECCRMLDIGQVG